MAELPPCGIYLTREPLGTTVPAGRLVYFHNHGDPGPGVYLPARWHQNRAEWQDRGTPIPEPSWAATLKPLVPEGLYRVRERFQCCSKQCRTFDADLLVQLGYDGSGRAILFVPEWTELGLRIPESGTVVDERELEKLGRLRVPEVAWKDDAEVQ